jgi:hypothetical protein
MAAAATAVWRSINLRFTDDGSFFDIRPPMRSEIKSKTEYGMVGEDITDTRSGEAGSPETRGIPKKDEWLCAPAKRVFIMGLNEKMFNLIPRFARPGRRIVCQAAAVRPYPDMRQLVHLDLCRSTSLASKCLNGRYYGTNGADCLLHRTRHFSRIAACRADSCCCVGPDHFLHLNV